MKSLLMAPLVAVLFVWAVVSCVPEKQTCDQKSALPWMVCK